MVSGKPGAVQRPVVTLTAQEAEEHFGWLARIEMMDAPATSMLTREALNWAPQQAAQLVDDIAS